MQTNNNELYRLTAEKTGKSEQQYKDIGNFVFASLYSNMRKPKTLILKLKGVGAWYLRKKRMQIMIEHFPPNFSKTKEDFTSEYSLLKYENKVDLFNLFSARIKDYEEYIELRDKIRQERYKDQKIINHDREAS